MVSNFRCISSYFIPIHHDLSSVRTVPARTCGALGAHIFLSDVTWKLRSDFFLAMPRCSELDSWTVGQGEAHHVTPKHPKTSQNQQPLYPLSTIHTAKVSANVPPLCHPAIGSPSSPESHPRSRWWRGAMPLGLEYPMHSRSFGNRMGFGIVG